MSTFRAAETKKMQITMEVIYVSNPDQIWLINWLTYIAQRLTGAWNKMDRSWSLYSYRRLCSAFLLNFYKKNPSKMSNAKLDYMFTVIPQNVQINKTFLLAQPQLKSQGYQTVLKLRMIVMDLNWAEACGENSSALNQRRATVEIIHSRIIWN